MEVHPGLRALALLFLLLSISASVKLHAQSSDDGLPAFSQGWTDQEKTAFRYCVSNISDSSRENTMQLSADSYACLIHEEQQHWMNLHPQAHGKKENHAKEHKCFAKHPLNSTLHLTCACVQHTGCLCQNLRHISIALRGFVSSEATKPRSIGDKSPLHSLTQFVCIARFHFLAPNYS
jgi:hypothetical protein